MLWAGSCICLHLEDGLSPGPAPRPGTEAEGGAGDLGRGQAGRGSSDPPSQCGRYLLRENANTVSTYDKRGLTFSILL